MKQVIKQTHKFIYRLRVTYVGQVGKVDVIKSTNDGGSDWVWLFNKWYLIQ